MKIFFLLMSLLVSEYTLSVGLVWEDNNQDSGDSANSTEAEDSGDTQLQSWIDSQIENQSSPDVRLLFGSVVLAPCQELMEHARDMVANQDTGIVSQYFSHPSTDEMSEKKNEICALVGVAIAPFGDLKAGENFWKVFDDPRDNEYGFILTTLDQENLTPEAALETIVGNEDPGVENLRFEGVNACTLSETSSDGDSDGDSDDESSDCSEQESPCNYFTFTGGVTSEWSTQVRLSASRIQNEQLRH